VSVPNDLKLLLALANNQLSAASAQIVLLESWKTLIQVGVAKVPGLIIDVSRGSDLGIKFVYGFQNQIQSRLESIKKLAEKETHTYLLDVVVSDLLDMGQVRPLCWNHASFL
jgi:hypothetical protein